MVYFKLHDRWISKYSSLAADYSSEMALIEYRTIGMWIKKNVGTWLRDAQIDGNTRWIQEPYTLNRVYDRSVMSRMKWTRYTVEHKKLDLKQCHLVCSSEQTNVVIRLQYSVQVWKLFLFQFNAGISIDTKMNRPTGNQIVTLWRGSLNIWRRNGAMLEKEPPK